MKIQVCPVCGNEMPTPKKAGRLRRFCKPACRLKAFKNRHRTNNPLPKAKREYYLDAAQRAGFSADTLPETAWFLFTAPPESTRVRIKVTARPQVASALKPWKDGFLPETECELLLEKRTRIIPAYENGVPVDMSQESDEVKQWHLMRDEQGKREDNHDDGLTQTNREKPNGVHLDESWQSPTLF